MCHRVNCQKCLSCATEESRLCSFLNKNKQLKEVGNTTTTSMTTMATVAAAVMTTAAAMVEKTIEKSEKVREKKNQQR